MRRVINIPVVNNKMHFKCISCGAKRIIIVRADIRNKNITCQKCGEVVRCRLNRRAASREINGGKAELRTLDGKVIEADLRDISIGGIGIDISTQALRAKVLEIGQKVNLNCKYHPKLKGTSRYVVVSLNAQRVGLKKIR